MPQRIAQLIADLDSKQFATRQKAEDELEKLGELVDPARSKCWPANRRWRPDSGSKSCGKRWSTAKRPPRKCFRLCGVAALEEMGTPEARQALENQPGAPGAKPTSEAKSALRPVGESLQIS